MDEDAAKAHEERLVRAHKQLAEVDALVREIKPILVGHEPEVQIAALGDLVAIFFAGSDPAICDLSFRLFIGTVDKLIPVNKAMGVTWDSEGSRTKL